MWFLSEKSVVARLESILRKIEDIEFIIQRHGGVVNALEDREGQPAILMLIEAIAEQFHKIETKNKALQVLKTFDPHILKGIQATRTVIAHDYDGIDLGLIELGLRDLPALKETLSQHLAEEPEQES